MHFSTRFANFLTNIRLTPKQNDVCIRGHKNLVRQLEEDATLKPLIVSTFLQGSYKRSTGVRPQDGSNADVDIIVVTRLSEKDYPDPGKAIDVFVPFVRKHYTDENGKAQWERQGRSIGIKLKQVDLDLVITSAPSESVEQLLVQRAFKESQTLEEYEAVRRGDMNFVKSLTESYRGETNDPLWQNSWQVLEKAVASMKSWQNDPLRIPDREAQKWHSTHPLEQISWTGAKNKACNGHYINVVRLVKWWRRHHPTPKYPKGYPIEHLTGVHCPNGIESVAEGFTQVLEGIVKAYAPHMAAGTRPHIGDHGVPDHNVFEHIEVEDFALFYSQIAEAAKWAREALNGNQEKAERCAGLWFQLFGEEFEASDAEKEAGEKPPVKSVPVTPTPVVSSSTRIITPAPVAPAPRPAPRPLKDNPYF